MIISKQIKNYIKMMNKLNKDQMNNLPKQIQNMIHQDLISKKLILIIQKKIKHLYQKKNFGDLDIDYHLIAQKIIKLEKKDYLIDI